MSGIPGKSEFSQAAADESWRKRVHQLLSGERKEKSRFLRLLPFLGPAFVASVAYIDPGNFATNMEAGARFGYALLWVIVASNIIALLLQTLSAKLGVASGRNLAEMCREQFPRPVAIGMWVLMEIVVMATDLAEFLGAALGLQLLFGLPLSISVFIAAVITLSLLVVQGRSFRAAEQLIAVFVLFIAACFTAEVLIALPDVRQLVGGLVPVLPNEGRLEAVWLATGILGATVMPHALFLHSSLTGGRIPTVTEGEKKRLHRLQLFDVGLALPLAGLVNAAMLLTAAAAFHFKGHPEVVGLEEAYHALEGSLGTLAKGAFGLALLASGISSSVVGTMAGQVIMQGFVRRQIPIWVRRLATMIPAVTIVAMGFDPTKSLIWSQVILSLGLPFAVIPLILFTANRKVMGGLTNHPAVTAVASICAVAILGLNGWLVYGILFHR